MELKQLNSIEISIRLLNSGRYVWTIISQYEADKSQEAIKKLKDIDEELRQEFEDHVTRGSGRVAQLEED